MNEDEKIIARLQAQLDRGMASIKAVAERLSTRQDPKEKQKSKHAGSKNHNKKRNKVRARMAAKSNQINRIRVKGWKH